MKDRKKMIVKKLTVTGALLLVTALITMLCSGAAYDGTRSSGSPGCSGCAIACAACTACTACTCLACLNGSGAGDAISSAFEDSGIDFGDFATGNFDTGSTYVDPDDDGFSVVNADEF